MGGGGRCVSRSERGIFIFWIAMYFTIESVSNWVPQRNHTFLFFLSPLSLNLSEMTNLFSPRKIFLLLHSGCHFYSRYSLCILSEVLKTSTSGHDLLIYLQWQAPMSPTKNISWFLSCPSHNRTVSEIRISM